MDEDSEFREMVMKKLESSGFMQKMRVSTYFLENILSILSCVFSRQSFELTSIMQSTWIRLNYMHPLRLICRKTAPNLKTLLKSL